MFFAKNSSGIKIYRYDLTTCAFWLMGLPDFDEVLRIRGPTSRNTVHQRNPHLSMEQSLSLP
ncbi:MAG: hypothetical protein ABL962_18605, partial [Fimbriimonadaceae bacterium]